MYELRVEAEFAAGHRLLNSGGPCDRPHGHNYRVEVFLQGAATDHRGMVYDFSDIKHELRSVVDSRWDHKFLVNSEDVALRHALEALDPDCLYVFHDINPTAEAMARELWQELRKMHGEMVSRVRVWESQKQYAEYREDNHC
jgi:6-pyruvoyltetrahydropterin/6-carboxytetrahydropterin synthase